MIEINAERLLADLYELRKIGTYKTGVHRPTLSEDDMIARRWFADRLTAMGHAAEIDGVANVIGTAPTDGPCLLSGSHLETQNHAGWLDGALGMIYALETARAIAESPTHSGMGVDVVAFADEEGHFESMFGSRSWVGELTEDIIDNARDQTTGTPLRTALAKADLADVPRARMPRDRYIAFLEAHIEQGDWLEANDLTIGIVTSIVGTWQDRIIVEGAQNHAGTTRMAIRRDAGVAATRLLQAIEREFPKVAGERSVWTTGRITLEPGARAIVPGRAEIMFQYRDADKKIMQRMFECLLELIAEENETGPCTIRHEVVGHAPPAHMDPVVQGAFTDAAERLFPGKHTMMPSGAGHDARVLSRHLPSGMLFIPSIGGISHHWSEQSTDEDIVAGARVFAAAAGELLSDARG